MKKLLAPALALTASLLAAIFLNDPALKVSVIIFSVWYLLIVTKGHFLIGNVSFTLSLSLLLFLNGNMADIFFISFAPLFISALIPAKKKPGPWSVEAGGHFFSAGDTHGGSGGL
jgi:hypothetical protein